MDDPDRATLSALGSPPLWNPNAAANWCILFTPAFGAYLHMLNWRALGESDKAAASQRWFYASVGMLALYLLIALMASDKVADGVPRLLGLIFLLSWYFASAREQARYVKQKFGADYTRQPWSKALGLAVLALVGYLLLAVVFGVVAAILAGNGRPSSAAF